MRDAILAVCAAAAVCVGLTACESNTASDDYISPQLADAEFREQEFIRQNAVAESAYIFEKADPDDYWKQITQMQDGQNGSCGCIMRLFDEAATVCPSEKYCALMLGKIWALFGEPNDPTVSEDFFNYTVKVTAADGTSCYLELYQYSGCPSVGGPVEDAKSEAAAKALAAKICATEPMDYEWSGTYEDFDVDIKYYVKDGMAGVEENLLDFAQWDEQEFSVPQ